MRQDDEGMDPGPGVGRQGEVRRDVGPIARPVGNFLELTQFYARERGVFLRCDIRTAGLEIDQVIDWRRAR
jgi:hypothetical protein